MDLELEKTEVKEFTLRYEGGLMWLHYKPYHNAFVIDINPFEIYKLMRNEGYKMDRFVHGVELKFTKSTLINTNQNEPVYGMLFFESNEDEIFPPVCYVLDK